MTKKYLIIAFTIIALVVVTWKILDIKKENRRAEIAKLPLLERGKALLEFEGCTSCHQSGNPFRAPILDKLVGSTVSLTNGTKIIADREYIIQSIFNPKAQIVYGFQGTMPAYQDRFSEVEIDAFMEAMK